MQRLLDERNVTVLSLDIFKCECSICQNPVGPNFTQPRRTMILCLLHGDRRGMLFHIFFLMPESLLKGEPVGMIFRVMSEEIQSIAVAVTRHQRTGEVSYTLLPLTGMVTQLKFTLQYPLD